MSNLKDSYFKQQDASTDKIACMDSTTAIGTIAETIFDGSYINFSGKTNNSRSFAITYAPSYKRYT